MIPNPNFKREIVIDWDEIRETYFKIRGGERHPQSASAFLHNLPTTQREADLFYGVTGEQMDEWLHNGFTSDEIQGADLYVKDIHLPEQIWDEEGENVDVCAALSGDDEPFVELDGADRVERFADIGALHGHGADAEVLLHGGAHRDACSRALVGVHRHERHIHERRLARLVEALAGNHRVVPIEHLALGRRRRGRRCRRHHLRLAARHADAAQEEGGGREQRGADDDEGDAGAIHGAPPMTSGR